MLLRWSRAGRHVGLGSDEDSEEAADGQQQLDVGR
jgi:hypothetical protein